MNQRETFLAILLLIGLVVGYVAIRKLISKGANAAATAVNKNVLFKSEYKEQQQFISTTKDLLISYLNLTTLSNLRECTVIKNSPLLKSSKKNWV